MSIKIVRRWASNMTHYADVPGTVAMVAFGAHYAAPMECRALCGVKVGPKDVVMQEGSKVKCQACKHLYRWKTEEEQA